MLVCTEEAPILKMCFTADQQGIWVLQTYKQKVTKAGFGAFDL